MSKELEAFLERRIIDINNYLKNNERSENEKNFPPVYELQICKLAKRMLVIDNVNPSEALECLEYLGTFGLETGVIVNRTNAYNTIKQALEIKSKKEQAWEIAVKKNVDINFLKCCGDVKYYNHAIHTLPMFRGLGMIDLTEEEFELLKEKLG